MASEGLNLKGLNFMVADSNENIRSIVHGILRGFGATNVIEVADGETAQRDIVTKHIDVLMCEVTLPKIDGFSLI
ncbi:MAG: response regulator, partial [Kiritimatiellia bacterium]